MALTALAANSKIPSLIYAVILLYLASLIWLLFGIVRSAVRTARTSQSPLTRLAGWAIAVTLLLVVLYAFGHDFARLPNVG